MTYLVDTNVVAELRKGARCDPAVAAWYRRLDGADLFLSVLTLGEIRKGAEGLRRRDPARARAIEAWLAAVRGAFADRILPVDRAVADAWGRMAALRPIPVVDGLMAATAKVHGLVLATRNTRDVAGLGARVFDPWRG